MFGLDKWIWEKLRTLGWIGVAAAIAYGAFALWSSLPDATKQRMVDAVVAPEAKPSAIDLAVAEFKLETPDDPDLLFLRNKIERNLVELFVANGRKVAHPLAIVAEAPGPHARLSGSLSRLDGETVEVAALLEDEAGRAVSSVSLEAPAALLRDNYKVIPETIIHGLDVSPRTLKPLREKSAAGGSRAIVNANPIPLPATMLYFEARRKAAASAFDEATEKLKQAIALAPRFAMAHWAIGELARAKGDRASAGDWARKAAAIDPDHPRLPIAPNVAQPLANLLPALKAAAWTKAVDGLDVRRLAPGAYDVAIDAWRFDATRTRLSVLPKSAPQGSSVARLRKASGAALVVNGGFFEIDSERRLTPTGFLVSGGGRTGAYAPAGGSALLFSSGGRAGVDFSKSWESLGPLDDAVQAGPMIVDPGGKNGIKANDFNRLNRTAVCLTGAHVVAVVVTGGLSLFELGEILAAPESDGGFGCERAINLDGGPSTQASFAAGGKKREIEGVWKVENAVAFALAPQSSAAK